MSEFLVVIVSVDAENFLLNVSVLTFARCHCQLVSPAFLLYAFYKSRVYPFLKKRNDRIPVDW